MKKEKMRFGLIPDEKDERDFKFVPKQFFELPLNVNLSFVNPNVYNQLSLGSCVYNAYGSLFQGRLRRQGQDFIPSRLFPYYNYRESIGRITEDTGSSMREAMKIYIKYGVPPEDYWPYDVKKFTQRPPKEAYDKALLHQVITGHSVDHNLYAMKACLAAADTFVGGLPFTNPSCHRT